MSAGHEITRTWSIVSQPQPLFATDLIERLLALVARCESVVASYERPSRQLRPDLTAIQTSDGHQFLAQYGGVLAWGTTPAEAFAEFDRIWMTGDE